MLIKKLKLYPRISQGGSYAPGPQGISPPVNTVQTAVSGQFTLSTTGADYIGPYHTMANGDYMTGATHSRGSIKLVPTTSGNQTITVGNTLVGRSNNNPTTSNAIQPQPYVPTAGELVEYEKYRVSGSLYKSNISYVNLRDNKGNISLRENENNELLVIENISNNFTNRSIVSAIDTQFRYFKFPAQISTTVDDIEFDESLLDIDVDAAISNDPYSGKIIRPSAGSSNRYYVQAGKKRRFSIVADSTWALKNNLPPFANIAGTIVGKDEGENNVEEYDEVTVITVPRSIFDGYITGDNYTPDDAFLEGNVYGKIRFETSISNNGDPNAIPAGKNLTINGPKFGRMEYTGIRENLGEGRIAEFVASEFSAANSYIGIAISNFNNTTSDLNNYNIISDNDPFGPYRSDATGLTAASLVKDVIINGGAVPVAIGERFKYDTTGPGGPQEYVPLQTDYYRYTVLTGYEDVNPLNFSQMAGTYANTYVGMNGESLSSAYDGKYIWYKVTLNIVKTGTKYRLLHDGTNITNQLRDRYNNKSGTDSVDLLSPEKPGNNYRGWVLNITDIFPNGFTPNTEEQFEIQFLNNETTSFPLDVYFIGWTYEDTPGTVGSYNIVIPSIHFGTIPNLTSSTMPKGPPFN